MYALTAAGLVILLAAGSLLSALSLYNTPTARTEPAGAADRSAASASTPRSSPPKRPPLAPITNTIPSPTSATPLCSGYHLRLEGYALNAYALYLNESLVRTNTFPDHTRFFDSFDLPPLLAGPTFFTLRISQPTRVDASASLPATLDDSTSPLSNAKLSLHIYCIPLGADRTPRNRILLYHRTYQAPTLRDDIAFSFFANTVFRSAQLTTPYTTPVITNILRATSTGAQLSQPQDILAWESHSLRDTFFSFLASTPRQAGPVVQRHLTDLHWMELYLPDTKHPDTIYFLYSSVDGSLLQRQPLLTTQAEEIFAISVFENHGGLSLYGFHNDRLFK